MVRSTLLAASVVLTLPVSAQDPVFLSARGPYSSGYVAFEHPSGVLVGHYGRATYVSSDLGFTWDRTGVGPLHDGDFELLPGGDILAVIEGRVRRSDDLGATWLDVGPPGPSIAHLATAPDGATWYAFTWLDAYRSNDQGVSWTPLPRGSTGGNIVDALVGLNGALLVAWSWTGDFVLRSTDGGLTWSTVTMPGGLQVGIRRFVRGRGGRLYAISYAVNNDVISSRDPALYLSTNEGATWVLQSTELVAGVADLIDGSRIVGLMEGLDDFTPNLLAGGPCDFHELSTGVLMANTCGYWIASMDPPSSSWAGSAFYRLNRDLNQWEQGGIVPGPVFALAMDDSEDLLAGGTGAVHRIRESAWTAAGWNQGEVAAMLPLGSGMVLVTGRAPPLVLTVDGETEPVEIEPCWGGCWTGAVGRSESGALFIGVTEWYYNMPVGLYRSDGFGSAWSYVLPDISNLTAFSSSGDGLLLTGALGVQTGPNGTDDGVFVSTDDGLTWAPSNAGLANRDIRSLYAAGGGVAFAGTNGGVARSTDGGVSWTPDGLATDTVFALATSSLGLLAGTGSGLYLRTDSGWQRFGSGIDDLAVLSILVHLDEDGELIGLGTESGVYANRTLVTTGIGLPAPMDPAYLLIEPPRPNPATTFTRVVFDNPVPGDVRISLFDVLGREVWATPAAHFGAGRYDAELPTGGLGAGVYLVRVSTAVSHVARPLTVAR
jgi:hypothetical protein